jgi:hypothetical protein
VVNNAKIDYLSFPAVANDGNSLKWMYVTSPVNKNRFASPIFARNFKDFPPILIQVGSKEIFHDEGVALAVKLVKDDSLVNLEIYNDHFHAFHAFFLPASFNAFKRASEFILNHIGKSDNSILSDKSSRIVFSHCGMNIVSRSSIEVSKNEGSLSSYSFSSRGYFVDPAIHIASEDVLDKTCKSVSSIYMDNSWIDCSNMEK